VKFHNILVKNTLRFLKRLINDAIDFGINFGGNLIGIGGSGVKVATEEYLLVSVTVNNRT